VQSFEQSLAVLSLSLEIEPRSDQTPAQAIRRLRKLLKRAVHRFQRASASELRKLLPEDFDPDLLPVIERLIESRDRLAHRYLLEKIVDRPNHRFAIGTPAELAALGSEFVEVTKHLAAKYEAIIASWPKGDVAEEVREYLESLARPVMCGED
jgi:hypothetical protein